MDIVERVNVEHDDVLLGIAGRIRMFDNVQHLSVLNVKDDVLKARPPDPSHGLIRKKYRLPVRRRVDLETGSGKIQ